MNNISLSIDSNIATITFIRTGSLNALNSETFDEINEVFKSLNTNRDVKVVLITGSGRAFVAGADIAEMQHKNSVEAAKFSNYGQQTFKMIEEFEKPVLAVVNGFALGGGLELALACDFIIASEKAKFSAPETNLGLIPGFCGSYRLSRAVGHATAKYLVFTAHTVNAQEAQRLNLVQKVVPHDGLSTEAIGLAKAICLKGPEAVKSAKRLLNTINITSHDENAALETKYFSELFDGEGKEGMSAFLEKRNPNW